MEAKRSVKFQTKHQERLIDTPKDAAQALRDLAGDRSYNQLRREHSDVCNSMGAWWAWLNGKRVPRLDRFLDVLHALGGELVVRKRPR